MMPKNYGLFAKLFIPLAVAISLIVISLVIYIPNVMKENAVNASLPTAVDTANQYKAIRSYYTQNVVNKVTGGSNLQPHFNHKEDPNKIPLPATFIHDISEQLSTQDIKIKLYSPFPFPNRNSRTLDSFSNDAWAALNKNPNQTFSRVESIKGEDVVRVAVADTMTSEGCVSCHNSYPQTPKVGWKLGDVRGILEIQMPITAQLLAAQTMQHKLAVVLLISAILSMAILVFLFRHFVTARLNHVVKLLNSISAGNSNLSQRLPVTSNDEVGAISKAFNNFMQKINHSLNDISLQVTPLVSTSQSLAQVAQESQSNAQSQLTETEQVACAMNEMDNSVHEIAGLANSTAENTLQTEKSVESARVVVDDNMKSVESLSLEMKQAAEVVTSLNTDSQNIGSVLDVIRSIAEQTNLLALNAAIEAARAGEQGRGFAVVADEVRTLASRTQSSTEEIQRMIEQLQAGAKDAVSSIKQGNETLSTSLIKASETRDAITSISTAIADIRNLNMQIATATEEQSSVSKEISRNIVNLSEITENNRHNTDAVQNSADEVSSTITTINLHIQQVTGKKLADIS